MKNQLVRALKSGNKKLYDKYIAMFGAEITGDDWNIEGEDFTGKFFENWDLSKLKFINCNFNSCVFYKANFFLTGFKDCSFDNTHFACAIFKFTKILDCDLRNTIGICLIKIGFYSGMFNIIYYNKITKEQKHCLSYQMKKISDAHYGKIEQETEPEQEQEQESQLSIFDYIKE